MTGLDVVIPNFIATVLKQSGWSRQTNGLIVMAVYIGWTAVSLVLGLRMTLDGTTALTLNDFHVALTSALASGYASYKLIWSNLGEGTLELKTSIVKGPVDEPVIDDGAPDDLPAEG